MSFYPGQNSTKAPVSTNAPNGNGTPQNGVTPTPTAAVYFFKFF